MKKVYFFITILFVSFCFVGSNASKAETEGAGRPSPSPSSTSRSGTPSPTPTPSFSLTPSPSPSQNTCKTSPSTPRLNISYPDANSGPRFEFSDDPNSDIADNFYWTYSTYDSSKNQWDPWNSLTTENLVNGHGYFTFQSTLIPGKTKIAFYVYSANKCGSSSRISESADGSGIPLAGRTQNTVNLKMNSIGILDNYPLTDLIELSTNLNFSANSKTPNVCLVSGQKVVPLAIGNCLFGITASSYYNVAELNDFGIVIKIVKNKQTLSNISNIEASIGEYLNLPATSDQGLGLLPKSITPNICKFDGNYIVAISAGTCKGVLINEGNDKYNSFKTDFMVEIVKLQQKIEVANLSSGLVIKNRVATILASASSGLPVTSNNLTPNVCTFANNLLKVTGSGSCSFELVQNGDKTYSPAPKVSIKMNITSAQAKLTITCVRGSVQKQISGSNPSCPSGYRLKP